MIGPSSAIAAASKVCSYVWSTNSMRRPGESSMIAGTTGFHAWVAGSLVCEPHWLVPVVGVP